LGLIKELKLQVNCTWELQSEQFLSSTSAQLGYTVPFTLVYAGKYVTRQIKNRHTTKTKHNPEKANNTKYSRTKL